MVVALKPQVLLDLPCSFYPQNAATARFQDIDPQNLQDEAAFEAMFGDIGCVKRDALGLEDSLPTDPQAEVLVFSNISPRYIVGVATESLKLRNKLRQEYNGWQVIRNSSLFSYRKDYEHWRG